MGFNEAEKGVVSSQRVMRDGESFAQLRVVVTAGVRYHILYLEVTPRAAMLVTNGIVCPGDLSARLFCLGLPYLFGI